MKYSILLFFTTICFLSSCVELEEDPQGIVAPSTFFDTQANLEQGVIAIYRPFSGFYLDNQGGLCTLGGDDVTSKTGGNKGVFSSYDRFVTAPTDPENWLVNHTYQPLFNTVIYANNVIANYENVPKSEARERAAAQAFFLRGWAYFNLVRTFGEVPLLTDLNVSGNEQRDDISLIYDQIISDIKFAIEYLPENWGAETTRVNVWAARHYLSKVYLTGAGWPLKRTNYYDSAAKMAKEVIDGGQFKLQESFSDVWDPEIDRTEAIQVVNACAIADCADFWVSFHLATSLAPEEEGGWDDYFAEIAFFNEFPEGPRKEATFQTVINGKPWEESLLKHPFYLKQRFGFGPGDWQRDTDPYIMRYSETLLIFAEADNKGSRRFTTESLEGVNKIRRRAAGLPLNDPDNSVDLSTGMSQADLHKAILAESGWEFAGEWYRWFDLVRNEMVAEATAKRLPFNPNAPLQEQPLNPEVDPNSEASFVKYYYAPIPGLEITTNGWEQNDCCN